MQPQKGAEDRRVRPASDASRAATQPLAFRGPTSAYAAFHGEGPFAAAGPDPSLRILIALYPEAFTVVARANTSIRDFQDLRGKRVGIGTIGVGYNFTRDVVLGFYGSTIPDPERVLEFAPAEQKRGLGRDYSKARSRGCNCRLALLRDIADASLEPRAVGLGVFPASNCKGGSEMARVSTGLLAGAVGFAVIAAAAIGVRAEGLVSIQKLSAPLANELVGEAVANCAQKGYAVTAAVVDLDGVRQAILRGNGAPIHTLDNAYYKGYSAASVTLALKEDSTKAVADRMSKNPATTVPQTPLPNVTYAVGGVAIMAGGNTIAGIGVSGAPGGNFDEECARAAIAKVQDRMK